MSARSNDDFFELASTLRACRTFTDQAVGDDELSRILDAATRAPSAENAQPWHFVVVRDADRRRRIAALMGGLWDRFGREHSRSRLSDDVFAAVDDGFGGGLVTAPVLVVVCGDTEQSRPEVLPSSVYPAVQNLLLAAHAQGLGSVLTTIAAVDPVALRELIEAPESIVPMAVVPIGHPARALGPSRREPLATKTSLDRYGTPWP
ncbi:MAG: nitroreductase family protein [Acidimicrobiia bacterium]|nr:nitroreductase family protein [Acidimicrobiia bacterium]